MATDALRFYFKLWSQQLSCCHPLPNSCVNIALLCYTSVSVLLPRVEVQVQHCSALIGIDNIIFMSLFFFKERTSYVIIQ
jgi:hypothetical protein